MNRTTDSDDDNVSIMLRRVNNSITTTTGVGAWRVCVARSTRPGYASQTAACVYVRGSDLSAARRTINRRLRAASTTASARTHAHAPMAARAPSGDGGGLLGGVAVRCAAAAAAAEIALTRHRRRWAGGVGRSQRGRAGKGAHTRAHTPAAAGAGHRLDG